MGGPCLTCTQLMKLRQHRFECKIQGQSLLVPILEPIWRWIALKLPMWIAPALFILTGCFVVVVCCLILLFQFPHFSHQREEIPAWSLLLASCGILIYQILNAIGSRERITSPIDQIIECACASVVNFIICLSAVYTVRMAEYCAYMLVFMFTAYFVFHLRHWETYVNGQVVIGNIHTPEVQLSVVLVYLLTAVFGSKLWTYEVTTIPYTGQIHIWQCTFILIFVFSLRFCWKKFSTILAGGVGKNGSSIAGTSVLSPGIPVVLILIFALYTHKHSKDQIFQKEPIMSLLTFCPCMAKITSKLQVSLITKHPVDATDNIMLAPFALVALTYLSLPIDERIALMASLVYCWYNFIAYLAKLCTEISHHLNINMFTEKEKTK